MIRALAYTVKVIAASLLVSGLLLTIATVASVGILIYGCRLALLPPKQGVTGILLNRLLK